MTKPKKNSWLTKEGKPTFTQIEDAVIQSKTLSGTEKLFYMTLKSFRNRMSKQCFPSMRTVFERCGMSKPTAYSARKKLETYGIIGWPATRGRNKRCHYRFILEDGNSHEISNALSNLSENKIVKNKTSENSQKENLPLVKNRTCKIVKNRPTNHMKYNQKKEPQQQKPKPEPINPPDEPQEKAAPRCLFCDLPKDHKDRIRAWKKMYHLTESLDELTNTLTENMGEGMPDEVHAWDKFINAKVDAKKSNGGLNDEAAYRGVMLSRYMTGEITADDVEEYNAQVKKADEVFLN
jgi:hypothetical protein